MTDLVLPKIDAYAAAYSLPETPVRRALREETERTIDVYKRQATDGGEIWTYFERGRGTAGFGGQVRGGSCRAYVLKFDKQAVLRGWEQQPCQG